MDLFQEINTFTITILIVAVICIGVIIFANSVKVKSYMNNKKSILHEINRIISNHEVVEAHVGIEEITKVSKRRVIRKRNLYVTFKNSQTQQVFKKIFSLNGIKVNYIDGLGRFLDVDIENEVIVLHAKAIATHDRIVDRRIHR
ncbi:hypothetical protein EDD63_11642 [Breznakia blatticola]|uniref:Uncharacterized protein n=1 Tax=Breznakia blatticola TaxID=1754012 RepID=A0A4R7ZWA0_9FIRM|nr:hypothetical protein [Breznakia blatticola]TDW19940.1 hypothetical protein EDD63_11642 [Breznakia blatticola]